MKKRFVIIAGVVFLGICAGGALVLHYRGQDNSITEDKIKKGSQSLKVSLHDPAVMVDNGRYYMYGSHMTAATSDNLLSWDSYADEVTEENSLFDNLLKEPFAAFDYVGKNDERWYSVWAPCVIYNETMKKYVMYFCTTSSYIKSDICMATADKPEGPYTYEDTLIYSGFTKSTVRKTNFYEVMGEDANLETYSNWGNYINTEWPNCIDPDVFYDKDGKMWMVYGSWSGGIFLLEIDPATGDVIHPEADESAGVDRYYGKRLIGGNHHAVEGPSIRYDEETGYYYLFVSYGELVTNGGYQIRQYRSENVDGPYVDAAGNTLAGEENFQDFGVKIMGNYTLPSLDVTYMAPGGQSVFIRDGKMYLAYHQRFDDGEEYHEPRIHQVFPNEDGWMVAAPFPVTEEDIGSETFTENDLRGTFYLLNHGLDVSDEVNEPVTVNLSGGKLSGDAQGHYEVKEGTHYMTLVVDDVEYKGVLLKMTDEAGNKTISFSGIGDNNQSVWAIQCIE